jgi:hypothetical protein
VVRDWTDGWWVEVLGKSTNIDLRDDGDFNASKFDHLEMNPRKAGWSESCSERIE